MCHMFNLKEPAAVSLASGQFIVHQDKTASPNMPLLKAIIILHKGTFINTSKQTDRQTHTHTHTSKPFVFFVSPPLSKETNSY